MSVSAISSAPQAHYTAKAAPAAPPPAVAAKPVDRPNDGDGDDGAKTSAAGAAGKSSAAVQSALSRLTVGGG